MIDFRFTGHINDNGHQYPIDVRFRTDAISVTDGAFNILQVQVGQEFTDSDNSDFAYQRFFQGNGFRRQQAQQGDFVNFAINHGLDLQAYDEKGKVTVLVDDASVSYSVYS